MTFIGISFEVLLSYLVRSNNIQQYKIQFVLKKSIKIKNYKEEIVSYPSDGRIQKTCNYERSHLSTDSFENINKVLLLSYCGLEIP